MAEILPITQRGCGEKTMTTLSEGRPETVDIPYRAAPRESFLSASVGGASQQKGERTRRSCTLRPQEA
jgi:hypothetical protein